MSHRQLATGLTALAAIVVPASALASSKPSHAKLFQNRAKTVTCGIELPLPGHKPSLVLCSGDGVPRAKTGTGDPFVQIGRTGKPKLMLVSQDEFVTSKVTTLRSGAIWRNLGVTCTVDGVKVTCRNTAGHGFRTGNHKYKSF